MANYDKVFQLLDQYKFDTGNDNCQDLLCTICKNIINNAYHSSCGCLFCFKCITRYLNTETKSCPGSTTKCPTQNLKMESDLRADNDTNQLVSMITVECPDMFCLHTTELSRLEIHMRNHRTKCPFSVFGCQESTLSIKNHIRNRQFFHAKSLMDFFGRLQREIMSGTTDVELMKAVCVIGMVEGVLENLKKTNVNQRNLILKLSMTIENSKVINQELRENVKRMRSELKETNNEIKQLKKESTIDENWINETNKRVDKKKRLQSIKNEKMVEVESKSVAQEHVVHHFLFMRHLANSIDLKERNYSPYQWKVENFNENLIASVFVRNMRIFSDSFYTHPGGYKLRLLICPAGSGSFKGTHLTVLFCILKGEYDDMLSWPMKYAVNVSLVDQILGLEYSNEIFSFDSAAKHHKYIFNRPVTETNHGYGTSEFISYDELLKNYRLYLNDSILMKCVIDIL